MMTQLTVERSQALAGKKVLVMGLGRFGGGVGVTKWLADQRAVVTVTDTAPAGELADSIKALEGLPIQFRLGSHDPADFLAADLIVINPAVDKQSSFVVQTALRKGVPYSTEMNLFLERCRAQTIGITGSVGKSTTTALIFEALKAALQKAPASGGEGPPTVYLGGNIGRSLLADLPSIRPQDFVVLELSSFMLEETPRIEWSPHIAVITNIFPNHLDRHRTMAGYTAAKQNILRFQNPGDVAVLNNDHDLVARWAHLARGKIVKYTTRGPASKKLNLAVPGEHNQSNAAAALAVLDTLGPSLDRPAAVRAIERFPGLAHRLQWVHTWELAMTGSNGAIRRVRFFNDSKATSPDASITALEAFPPRSAIFIVGGYDKHIDLSAFEDLLAERAGGVIGIGQTGQAIISHVQQRESAMPPAIYAGTLERAVRISREWAADPGSRIDAIVLSPASASWDQFPNYEKRGEQFSSLVRSG
jgi:UDP-N-acetylmuramoylalanine--D-glutamate ligase